MLHKELAFSGGDQLLGLEQGQRAPPAAAAPACPGVHGAGFAQEYKL